MITVGSRVTLNMPVIKRLERAAVTALEKTAEALHTEVEQAQVIPFRYGNLQNESTFVDYSESNSGKVSIISSTPYARRLYYHPEYKFNTEENPYAKGRWYEDWISGKQKDFCKKAFEKFVREEANL